MTTTIAVIGLGYVGLPLVVEFGRQVRTIGFDILADKFRGYVGLTMDMETQPAKVLRACEALAPHLYHVAKTSADASKTVPIGYWMHRGCVPFINPRQFDSHYWPTLKPCIEEFWKNGHQTLFYAEGKWAAHLGAFALAGPPCTNR